MASTLLSTVDITAGTPTPIDRLELPQYSLRQILAVWLAATVPMSILGWGIAPWLSDRIGGRDPFLDALLICFNLGLIWMIVLVLILVRREQGSLSWSHLRDALWLLAPRDPKSGRVGGRVWWWVLPFTLFTAVVNALPIDPIGPLPRDLPQAIQTARVADYFHGNWGGFALLMALIFLAPLAEELVFRGLLLPRMRAVFGRWDFVAFYDFPEEHWVHLRTSNPIESIFSGVRLRTNASKRLKVRENALYLVFKLVLRLSLNWRGINAPNQLRLLLAGHQFRDGQLVLEAAAPPLARAVGA